MPKDTWEDKEEEEKQQQGEEERGSKNKSARTTTYRLARIRKLDLAIDATRSEQGRIENVHAVGAHQHLDVLGALEAVKLVQKLEHSALVMRIRKNNEV